MKTRKGAGTGAAARNKPRASRGTAAGRAGRRASPELAAAIQALAAAGSRPSGPTLAEVRATLQTGVTVSPEGELLFPQDRTALVIEIDELIDVHGKGTAASAVISRRRVAGGPRTRLT
jgi:hypothetical protein